MKILISGGHLTPALALIDFIKLEHADDEIIFCGRLYTQSASQQASHEVDEVTRRGVNFIPFSAPKVGLAAPRWSWILVVGQLISAIFRAIVMILRQRPHVFVSFGGYLAIPIAVACFICRVPIVTHEQTRVAGSANRFISKMARMVAVSYPETMKYFNPKKTIVTGNPLRRQLFVSQPQPEWVPKDTTKPLLYITGGNQGSSILNFTTQQALKPLTKQWTIIHQCGAATTKQNSLADLMKTRATLPVASQNRYIVREWVTEAELGWIYQHVQTVVSRAGANTVAELTYLHVPAVFVPLPFANFDEQNQNAEALAKLGGAVIIPQRDLSVKNLITALDKINRYRKSMSTKLKALKIPLEADQKLYEVIQMVVSRT